MTFNNNHTNLEGGILALQDRAKEGPLSLGEILSTLSGKGRCLILILLSIPFCQPIIIPGFSIPFGLVIALIGMLLAFRKQIWLPERLLAKKIPQETLKKMTASAQKLVRKMQRWISPRFNGLCQSSFMQMTNGLLIVGLGIFLALPLPIPFSNLTAAWAIFLIALGIMEGDGLLVLIGYALSILTLIILIFIILSIKHLFI